MRYVSIKAAILIAGGILSLCLYFAACDSKKPVEPVQLKDYSVYFCDLNSDDQYFGYHPLTGQLDSFSIPIKPERGMTVSADGKKLYLALADSSFVVDLDDLHNITKLPYSAGGGVAVSPDNQLVAILGNGLNILSTSDYSVIFDDTDGVRFGTFSTDSKSFYCLGGDTYVYKVALDGSSPVTRKWLSGGWSYQIIPSVDEAKWFLYSIIAECRYLFEVYDVDKDSVIFREYISPGNGEMELSLDGRYLFYTNPGFRISYCIDPPPSSFTAFDVEKNQIHRVISTIGVFDGTNPDFWPIGSVEITPDGHWLVGMDTDFEALLVLDITKMEIEKYILLSGQRYLYGLTCQNAP